MKTKIYLLNIKINKKKKTKKVLKKMKILF